LIACRRCSLLRFVGAASPVRPATFLDGIHFHHLGDGLAGRWYRLLLRAGLRSKAGFVGKSLGQPGCNGIVLDLSGDDGTTARAMEQWDARVLAVSSQEDHSRKAFHEQGVFAVTADAAAPPLRAPLFDLVTRLRGFAHDEDPVAWLETAKVVLKPGGRVIAQAHDSASWAFLFAGSHWTGLEGACASYAFRSADLEVLLDFCGYRIVRRSHFFPFLNAAAWVSSLFPGLDPQSRRVSTPSGNRAMLGLDLLYSLLLLAFMPLAFVESICDAGTVLMVEAEPK
jgi:SAM-dependent methyltransferase